MNVLHLAGLVINSEQPEALARFYRDALGVPFTLQSHGRMREHYECELAGVHFAILKRKVPAGGAFTPSLACTNLEAALADLATRQIKPLHPIIDLGDGKRVCSIADSDGNVVRLFQQVAST